MPKCEYRCRGDVNAQFLSSQRLRKYCFAACVSLALVMSIVRGAGTEVLTTGEKNVIGLMEAALLSYLELGQTFGVSQDVLSFIGAFTESELTLTTSGTYQGMPVELRFSGQFADTTNVGMLDSVGEIGTSSWLGSAKWMFEDIDPSTVAMRWESQTTITLASGAAEKPDKHGIKTITLHPGEPASSEEVVFVTENGAAVDTLRGIDAIRSDFAKAQIADFEARAVIHTILGPIVGELRVVPAAPSALLLGTGLLCLGLVSWRQRSGRSSSF